MEPAADKTAQSARLQYARVLVEIGELDEAETEIAEALDGAPDDLDALNLLSKIKHMKGELSQAIACWAQLHARSPHNELTRMRLGVLLQMAKDPARAAGEYVALGQTDTGRIAAVNGEIEAALGLLVQRRPDDARATCDRIAAKYHGRDREAYKLAVMAKAWISELKGDLETACRVLEQLGQERGFETDADRALALARIYERQGTRESLEKAVHVFRYLDRSYEKMSAQSRLASLHRKLGDEARARDYEKRFTESFERRMHRVSLHEAAAVAAEHYLPIERLRAIRTVTYSDEGEPSPRAVAIERAIQGDVAPAREAFAKGGAALDRRYLANLAALAGDEREAARLFVSTLVERGEGSDAGDDARVLDWLLTHGLDADPVVRAWLARPGVLDGARAYVESALRARPQRAALWRDLASLAGVTGDEAEARRCLERAAALDDAARRDASAIGRVLAAAVYQFVGKSKGLIHQIWVDRRPVDPGRGGSLHADDILGNVTTEMRQATRNVFFAVREYARSRFPHRTADALDYDYTYKVTKEDEPSGGLSAGLPTALAFLSMFIQRAVPQDVAYSGVLIAEAHDVLVVRHVGDSEFKVKAAYNRNLRLLLLPRDNRVDVEGNPQIPRAVSTELVRYVSSLNDAVTLTWGEDVWTQ